jgi:hypothetical protein
MANGNGNSGGGNRGDGNRGDAAVLEREVAADSLAIAGGGEVDIQVTTARRYPRSITQFVRKAQEMATLTPEIAASCIYAIPRDGKTVEGPSARFAEVMVSAWGNMRAEGKTIGDDGQFVTARGTAWDVESNVAIAFEVKRRITKANGQTFNADMVMTTGNAASSIALRNAILKVIPTAFWKPIYNSVRQVIAGDAKTFAVRRDDMLKAFAVMGVTVERVCAAIGVKGKADITLEHMATLTGFYNALKDGDTTIEEAFPEGGGLGAFQAPRRKSEAASQDGQNGAQTSATTAETQTSTTAADASQGTMDGVVTVADVVVGKGKVNGKDAVKFSVVLTDGRKADTFDPKVVQFAQTAKASTHETQMVVHDGAITRLIVTDDDGQKFEAVPENGK